jgi:type VI protein secretion system component Hcp
MSERNLATVDQAEQERQMNTDRDTQRGITLLTDIDLDAVVGGSTGGGGVAMQDFHFVKKVDKASAKLLLG